MQIFKTFLQILSSGMKTLQIVKLVILSENNYPVPIDTVTNIV